VYAVLQGRAGVVIGGDEAATGRVQALLEAGARVTVISPTLTPTLAALAETHEIMHHARAYRPGDLRGVVLAIAVTDDDALAAAIAAEADAERTWLNVMDKPRFCNVIAPAVVRRGDVTVAVSTGGASPALARYMREEIERVIGPEYGVAATLLGKLRPLVAARYADAGRRAQTFGALVGSGLLAALRAGDAAAVDAILAEHVGVRASLATLGVSLTAGDDGNAAS
jgi:precorrin-2 dehydrogenase/sirohydrochlorin ferrochelatase